MFHAENKAENQFLASTLQVWFHGQCKIESLTSKPSKAVVWPTDQAEIKSSWLRCRLTSSLRSKFWTLDTIGLVHI